MMISLVICTYNRSHKLPTLLRSLERLDLAGDFTCEVIIVDNNSTDGTRDVVAAISKASPLVIKYVLEPKQGLGHARNRGITEARGDVLAFTDDDCIPETNWIRVIATKFSSEPSLAGVGGRVELYDESDRPVTIRTTREIAEPQSVHQLFRLIAGCNIAFRRGVFDEVGHFDPAFGAGTKIPAAEDWDFLYRAYKKGLKIRYYPDVLVYHDHGRKTDAVVNDLHRDYECGQGAFYCKYILQGDRIIMRMAIREVTLAIRILTRNLLRGHSIERERLALYGLFVGVIRGLPIFLRRTVASR
jgi:glycosyltransferase involved in cell wall biosynthesis